MAKKIQNKGVRNAHILLGAYWVTRVLGGRHPLKAAIDVLEMERLSIINEAKRAGAEKQADKKRGFNKSRDHKDASQAAVTASLSAGRRKASASLRQPASGTARSRALKKAAGTILRSAKVI